MKHLEKSRAANTNSTYSPIPSRKVEQPETVLQVIGLLVDFEALSDTRTKEQLEIVNPFSSI
jgi:hypothetical protein